MTVVAQITDAHLIDGEPWRAEALAAAVETVASASARIDAVLVTGDLADLGRPADYAPAGELLGRLGVPVVVVPGNHDDRGALRAALDLPGEAEEPLRAVLNLPGLRIVAGDTLVPGHVGGDVDVPWLAEQLAADRRTPTLVALHHVPVDIASVEMDQIGVPACARAALGELLASAPNVVGVACGHVHRGTLSSLGGVPVLTAPSCLVQFSLDLPGGPRMVRTDAPAGVAFHTLVDGRLVTHLQPVAPRP